jgi:predicted pyridoxine 5'-phosphate oxidase superfamily flavin-nucleotide-binding protein
VKAKSEHAGEERTFHAGEAACQAEAMVAERMERVGPQVIRGYMPEQHRDFFPQLPFIVTGSVDQHGQPSASLLAAPPGFVFSTDARTLRVDALPTLGDPLHANLVEGAPLGLLGIQAQTRRRNRLNGRVLRLDELGFTLRVDQSFGNCPKYITPREAVYVGSAVRREALVSSELDERARALITCADTFYLASAHPRARESRAPSEGVDVSHRGGPPGFARFIDDRSFVIPDFRGNDFFNTLGNLRLEPRAGLVFVDFVRGDVLALEAEARAHAGRHPFDGDAGTGRVVRFEITRARFQVGASPLRFRTTEP